MDEVNVTQLRQQLQRYLTRAARGERVRVTHRGRVIAEIGPPMQPDLASAQAVRARLAGTLLSFDAPTEPVLEAGEWAMNR